MKWSSKLTVVNINTGEEIYGCKEWILENYKILGKERKSEYVNTMTGVINITWLVTNKIKQIKLEL
jgi:hypothetical protein